MLQSCAVALQRQKKKREAHPSVRVCEIVFFFLWSAHWLLSSTATYLGQRFAEILI